MYWCYRQAATVDLGTTVCIPTKILRYSRTMRALLLCSCAQQGGSNRTCWLSMLRFGAPDLPMSLVVIVYCCCSPCDGGMSWDLRQAARTVNLGNNTQHRLPTSKECCERSGYVGSQLSRDYSFADVANVWCRLCYSALVASLSGSLPARYTRDFSFLVCNDFCAELGGRSSVTCKDLHDRISNRTQLDHNLVYNSSSQRRFTDPLVPGGVGCVILCL